MASKHDQAAQRIAKKHGASYNRGQGADVQGKQSAIGVETAETAKDGLRQLRGYRMPVYIAGADAEAVKKAMKVTENTTVGVMNNKGEVLKRSTRNRR